MTETKKNIRSGPSESATKFKVGTQKKGNDGNMWKIITTSTGTHRWIKIKKKQVTQKSKPIEQGISVEKIKQLNKKYNVTTNGTKNELVVRLWKVKNVAVTDKDLLLIKNLLPKKEQQRVEKLINDRQKHPNINYRGLWEPIPKPLSKMDREELIKYLKKFRDVWEKITERNQDLSNERLDSEKTTDLRSLLKFYYSNDSKRIAEDWLRGI